MQPKSGEAFGSLRKLGARWIPRLWPWLLLGLITILLVAFWFTTIRPIGWIEWLGVRQKTGWDLLELAIIPLVLAVGGILFSRAERKAEREIAKARDDTERAIATDRSQENLLQTYLDRMTDLLLKEGLRTSAPDSEARAAARARTLSVLRGLDGRRKGLLLEFIYDAGLVKKEKTVLDLHGTDLRGANLGEANLVAANLGGADLRGADLGGAYLNGADLRGAKLHEANLFAADLEGADLRGADLGFAKLSGAHLVEADLLGAKLFRADLSGAKLFLADLGGADLRGANLDGADLDTADLTGANLQDAKISAEQLEAAVSLIGATLPDGTKHE